MPDLGSTEKIGSVYVEITARADKLEKELKDLRGTVEKSATSLGNVFGSFFSKALASVGAFVGLQQLIGFSKDAIKLAKEQAKAEAGVKQAIEQTGRAAGFSAEQLFKEAAALQELSGVGDELTLANVTKQFLTFTNIVGDNFLRAQKAVLDLNAVINQGAVSGLTSQSIQLGKALEDPIKGISALSRNGITFTEQQKNLIKTLVESGNLFKAQGLILDEIEAKYGGQAKALADASAGTLQLSAAFGDFMERLGKNFIPFLESSSISLTKFFNSLLSDEPKSLEREIDDLNKSARDQVLTFEQLTRQYYSLRSESKRTAAQSKLYLETIRDLEKKYPNYLKNIDLEKDKVEKVAGAFRNAKIELEKYLEVQIKETIISKKKEEIVKIGEAQYNLEKRRQELTNKALGQITTLKPLKSSQILPVEIKTKVETKSDEAPLEDQRIFEGIAKGYERQRDALQTEISSILEEVNKIIATPPTPPPDKPIKLEYNVVPKLKLETRGIGDNVAKEINDKMQLSDAQIDIFDKLKFEASGYYYFRLQQIDAEGEAFKKAGASSLSVEQFLINSKKELNEAYYAYLDGKRDERLTKEEAAYQRLAAAQSENFDFVTASYDSLVSGFDAAFDDIRISADKANSVLEKGFIGMANTFIAQVKRMIAQALAFKAITAALNALGIPISIKALGGATGGSFEGSSSGVKRAATGGSFSSPGSRGGIKQLATGGSLTPSREAIRLATGGSVTPSATIVRFATGGTISAPPTTQRLATGGTSSSPPETVVKLATGGTVTAPRETRKLATGGSFVVPEIVQKFATGGSYSAPGGARRLATGGSVSAPSVQRLATGGVSRPSESVKKLAIGGSFIVPEGYQGDTYPLLVQSGERVTVTPAGGVAQQERMLSQIREAVGDIGSLMVNNKNKFEFRANLEGFLAGQDIRMSYDRTRRVEKRLK